MTTRIANLPWTALVVAALAVLLGGCVSAASTLAPDLAAAIPRAATVIHLRSALPADSLLSVLNETFAQRSVRPRALVLVDGDRIRQSYMAGPIDAGRGTFVFADVSVEPEPGGSVARLRGEWGRVRAGQVPLPYRAAHGALERAAWVGGRPGIAFGTLVTILKEAAPDARLSYE